MASTSGVDLSISGLASGFDWKTVVTQLANAERAPETLWKNSQTTINGKNTAFDRIKTFLSNLQSDVQALKAPDLYANRTASTSDSTKASASASSSATPGIYKFTITTLATAAQITGTGDIGGAIAPDGNLSAVTVADAGFPAIVTAGTFTINGKQVSIATTDTLQQVFDNIATATGNNVTASYSATTDKITLASNDGSEVVLGSATDTSNFLQAAQLYNSGKSTTTSASKLGRPILSTTIYDSAPQLATAVAGGFTTAVTSGTFTVNGSKVTIADGDTLQTVLSNIAKATNNAVTANYDAATDKVTLTSADGATPVTLGDAADTSNFLQAAKLASSGASGVTSSSAVGGVKAFATHVGLSTPITGDGSAVEQLATAASSGFGTAVTAGTFTINGAQVTIGASDSLQTIFNNIAAATNNAVTASYDAGTDKITLASSGAITLGDGSDTSNFLQATQLTANSTGEVTSAARLGGVHAQGALSINGVVINYNAGTDSIQNILDRINNSTAGVNASYDSQNDRFVLANKSSGDVGISMQDLSGNFLAATGLSGGTFAHGNNLHYTVNDGTQDLVSTSNTITSDSSNISGLSVTALDLGSFNVTVGSDTSKIKTAIQTFITDYNTVQTYISTQTASSTDSTGNVTSGILSGDMDANQLASNLRSLSFSQFSGLSGTIDQLAKLGIQTNGKDNSITLSDSSALDNALATNLSSVQSLFTDSKNGLASKLDTYLTNTIGDNGTLTQHQSALTKQSSSIDTQIANLEKVITADSASWTKAFQAMEVAQSQINQEMTYLNQQISNGTL